MTGLTVIAIGGTEEGQVVGYYGDRRRRSGERFKIAKPRDFSHRWMEAVGWKPPPPKYPVLGTQEETLVALDERHTFRNERPGERVEEPVDEPLIEEEPDEEEEDLEEPVEEELVDEAPPPPKKGKKRKE